MGCLDLFTKVAMMLDKLSITNQMLSDDVIRPSLKARLLDDRRRLRRELKSLYYELFKIIEN